MKSTRELLAEGGISAITTPNIAAKAAIPVGSIYQYFPNKKAIVAALYEDYLAKVRNPIEQLEELNDPDIGWRAAFTTLFRSIIRQESKDDLYVELQKIFALYPELLEIEQAHSDSVIGFIADFMKKKGSRWSKARRQRLARFIYSINDGVWQYRSTWAAANRETTEWEFLAIFAALEQAFDN